MEVYAVLAVLCLAVLPDFFNAFVVWMGWVQPPTSFWFTGASLIIRSVKVTVPVLLIAALMHVEWRSLGLVKFVWIPDILFGLGVWVFGLGVYYAVATLLPVGSIPVSQRAAEPRNLLLVVAAACANGFAEEFVLRGYLLTRLERLLKSTWLALGITSVLFASYHLYQGVGPTLGVVAIGLVYGGAFCLCRRIWPVAIGHAITNACVWLLG